MRSAKNPSKLRLELASRDWLPRSAKKDPEARGRNEMPVDPIPGRSAAEIVRLLDLHPHPEGGFFRETFRDPARDARGRAVSTLIYFLLDAGQVSRWHKVDATEVWHFYAGAPLEITISQNGSETSLHRLGPDLFAGERPAVGRSGALLAEGDEPGSVDARWLRRRAGLRILRLRTRTAGLAAQFVQRESGREITRATSERWLHSLGASASIRFFS